MWQCGLSAKLNISLQISNRGEREARSSTPYTDYLRWAPSTLIRAGPTLFSPLTCSYSGLSQTCDEIIRPSLYFSKAEQLGLRSCPPGDVRRAPPPLTAPSLLSRTGLRERRTSSSSRNYRTDITEISVNVTGNTPTNNTAR